MNTLTNATDFQKISVELRQGLREIGFNPDLKRMFDNIEKMVSELSRREVEARRLHSPHMLDREVEEINKAIKHLVSLILVARLMV